MDHQPPRIAPMSEVEELAQKADAAIYLLHMAEESIRIVFVGDVDVQTLPMMPGQQVADTALTFPDGCSYMLVRTNLEENH